MKKKSNSFPLLVLIIFLGTLIQAKLILNNTTYESTVLLNESPYIELPSIVNEIKSYSSELSYSTYLGGSDTDERTYLAVDQEKNIWITGATTSLNFPTTANAYNQTHGGSIDIFVAKIDGKNGSLLYSTFVGGVGYELPHTMEIDANQDIWICGETGSIDFPTTSNAYDKVLNGSVDAFVFKLSGINGTLLYSTFIGGSDGDAATAIEFDSQNNVWFTGMTFSTDFPTTPLALYPQFNGSVDIFLCQLADNGSNLDYSTYLGGDDADYSYSLAFTSSDEIWVTGQTSSMNFPLTPDANDSILGGSNDIYLVKLSEGGTSLLYSTFIGGGASDSPGSIAIDKSGDIWMTGQTNSGNFPTTTDAYDSSYGGSYDAFLVKISGNTGNYSYSTYLGGNNQDYARSVNIDVNGYVWIAGETSSDPFPITPDAYNSTYSGSRDAFILAMAPNQTLAYSTYVGGSDIESFTDLALDPAGKVWISGQTESLNFPTTSNAYNDTHSGSRDAFLFSLMLYSAPQSPSQLSIIESSAQDAVLTWQRPQYEGNSPISTYRVYRNTSPIFESYLTETSLEYYIDETVVPEITYFYTITAINSYGESEFAVIVNFTIVLPKNEPSAPQNLLGVNETTSIYLTWEIPLNDGGTPILNYSIYRRELCGTYILLDTTIELFFNDTSVIEGITYYYKVAATNNIGEGLISNEIPGKIGDTTSPVIDHPYDLEIIEGSLNHRITWHVSDINPASLIITRNSVLIISAAWNGDNISINVDNLTIGIYSYNCTVIDQAGNSAFDVVEVLVTTVTQTTTITTTTSTTTASSTSEGTPGYSFILFLAVIVISVILRRKVDE